MKQVPSYKQRVARIQSPGDEQKELERAKAYMMRLRRELKNAKSLDRKKILMPAVKEAESVLRRMRANIFKLEDLALARSNSRRAAQMDYDIMRLRSRASARGATPVEVERNVLALTSAGEQGTAQTPSLRTARHSR